MSAVIQELIHKILCNFALCTFRCWLHFECMLCNRWHCYSVIFILVYCVVGNFTKFGMPIVDFDVCCATNDAAEICFCDILSFYEHWVHWTLIYACSMLLLVVNASFAFMSKDIRESVQFPYIAYTRLWLNIFQILGGWGHMNLSMGN